MPTDRPAASRQGPLKGMKVLDMAHVMAGPICARMLADMGADVIKVEKADGGDDTRKMLPPDIKGESAAYMMMNRNKRGIVLDLKKPAGREALKRSLTPRPIGEENRQLLTGRQSNAGRSPGQAPALRA